jgi:hypothetical protein
VSCPQGAEFGFAVVSDGMGGHAAGDLASRIIVAEIFAELTLRGRASHADPDALSELLQASVEMANSSLQAQIEAYPDQEGMGGTVVATSLVDGGLQWVSVGDSLLYLLRDGMLKRLNDDHSMGPQIDLMARNGMIDAGGRAQPSAAQLPDFRPDRQGHPRARLHGQAAGTGGWRHHRSGQRRASVGRGGGHRLDPRRDLGHLRKPRHRAALILRAVAAEGVSDQDNTSVAVIRVYQPEPQVEVMAGARGRRAGAPPPVHLVRAGRDPRASRTSRHRNGEAGRLTDDGDGSRYPVHAQAARGASRLGCPDAGGSRELFGPCRGPAPSRACRHPRPVRA